MPSNRYRKKPVEIEAWFLDVNDYDDEMLAASWCDGETVGEGFEPHIIAITTLEGTMYADHGDWIIKGVKGEFYPCKPDIFAATYEPVSSGTAAKEERT